MLIAVKRGSRSWTTDFDGDEYNMTLYLDKKMADGMSTFRVYNNVRQLDRPGRVSDNIYISKPIVGALAAALA